MTADGNLSKLLAGASDAELEARLQHLGQSIAWPSARDLSATVRDRIAVERPHRSGVLRPRRSGALRLPALRLPGWRLLPQGRVRRAVLLAAAALLLIAAVAVALALGVPGIVIRFGPLPTVTPTASTTASPAASSSPAASLAPPPSTGVATTPPGSIAAAASPSPSGGGLGASLSLGRLLSLADARTSVDWPVLVPTLPNLGPPAETWLDGSGHAAAVSFVWPGDPTRPAVPESSIGLLLTQFRGYVDAERLGKTLGPDSRILPVVVNGEQGFWISGALHALEYPDAGDGLGQDHVRLAGDVLIWTRGSVTLRLEIAGNLEDALRIAESVR